MPTGYCTVDDVRRVMQETAANFDAGALGENNNQLVVDAITGLSEYIEKATNRHWYDPTLVGDSSVGDHDLLPTAPQTRDDEHDLPTHGGFVHGASEFDRYRYRANSDALLESGPRYDRRRKHRRRPKQEIRIATGDAAALEPPIDESVPAYTRIQLARKDAQAITELSVVNADGGYDDWVANSSYTGGVGNAHRGEDYWLRVNSGGVSELYLDVHAMDDDIASLSNAVYVAFDYGHIGFPDAVRRGTAFLAASELIIDDEFITSIPDNGQLVNVETKADRWERLGAERLQPYVSELPDDQRLGLLEK